MSHLEVLGHDNHLLVVAKPAGLPTVPDRSGDASLVDLARDWIRVAGRKPGRVFVGVVHRLDRPVSGAVVFARTSKAASRLSLQFRERSARKVYWGVGTGRPSFDAGVESVLMEQWLVKDAERNRVRVVAPDHPGARRAVTRCRLLATEGGRSLLELEPHTGRPHQLRVVAAALGCPLLGDLKYGARQALSDASVALHGLALELDHPTSGERRTFACAPPERPWWAFPDRQALLAGLPVG